MAKFETFSILNQFGDFESLGIAPLGHRVTFSTPEILAIEISVKAVLARGSTAGQAEPVFIEIVRRHLADLRRDVVDEWEKTYFKNVGVGNAFVDAGKPEWFPALAAKQAHAWHTFVRPQVLGVGFLATGLIDALDFGSFAINGQSDPNGLRIAQNEERQRMPVFGGFNLTPVESIGRGVS